jgi:hypothetical protein
MQLVLETLIRLAGCHAGAKVGIRGDGTTLERVVPRSLAGGSVQ